MRKRIGWAVVALLIVCAAVAGGGAWWSYSIVRGSLPQIDGVLDLADVDEPIDVARDAQGIPVIRGATRHDVAFGLGFAHAQDRFFQMDLLRRNAAGELAELIGPAVLEEDKQNRVHRFRRRARQVVEAGSPEQRELLDRYTAGVNAGLGSMRCKPFEYYLLGVDPTPWNTEDCVLVVYTMYLDLQGNDHLRESTRGVLHDLLPRPLAEFLAPRGCSWDAPIEGESFEMPPIPGPDVYDLRAAASAPRSSPETGGALEPDPMPRGSNNWAVAGSHTRSGSALLANDMHLGIAVPHIWYRASLEWPDAEHPGQTCRITGPTLPGTPAVVVGSNGHVAWGFTNSEGDWTDVVILEIDPGDPQNYLTPEGPRAFETAQETIRVKGQADETLEVKETIWGPVVDQDHRGRPRARRWVAYDVDAVNLGLIGLENAQTLEDALQIANQCGSPHQNFTLVDDRGRIAWTICGRIPRRVGGDGLLPASWADGTRRWDGYLEPHEYPRVVDPPQGRIWTANSRVVSGRNYELVGHGGYDLGARASQIRDGLMTLEQADEADMLALQLDDRALFLDRYQKLLLEALTDEAIAGHPLRGEARAYVRDWGKAASIDSVGFTIVRRFHRELARQVLESITAPCRAADGRFRIQGIEQSEGAVWKLVTEQPAHLLDPKFKDWNEQILAACDAALADLTRDQAALADQAWGAHNTTRIQHPISLAVPRLSAWLDMRAEPLPGDSADLPRIQAPAMGASQRMAVSPGRESEGYFHMPCGQSGHPLSPFYRTEHAAWAEGRATPFLPGPAAHRLQLK